MITRICNNSAAGVCHPMLWKAHTDFLWNNSSSEICLLRKIAEMTCSLVSKKRTFGLFQKQVIHVGRKHVHCGRGHGDLGKFTKKIQHKLKIPSNTINNSSNFLHWGYSRNSCLLAVCASFLLILMRYGFLYFPSILMRDARATNVNGEYTCV